MSRISGERLDELISWHSFVHAKQSHRDLLAALLELKSLRSNLDVEPTAWLKEWRDLNGVRQRVDLTPEIEHWLQELSPVVHPLWLWNRD